jgi:large subunit ribosomal protein L6
MSRIGKKAIAVPDKVELKIDQTNQTITVKGPKGELSRKLHRSIGLSQEGKTLTVSVKDPEDRIQKAIWGTTRAIINNMILGVTDEFKREVELNGVGYKMELNKDELTLYIGFSHPVKVAVPAIIKLSLTKNVLSGVSIDNEVIGNFFSSLHNMKPCDPYKHKGFKFPNRFYRKKAVKKGK